MIELMIAVAVIAVMVVGAGSALTSTMRLNQFMREEAAAIRAAETKLAEIRAAAFVYAATNYGNHTFRVSLLRGHDPSMGLEVSGAAQSEGEVVLVTNETPDETAYGRDLDDEPGPDGVDLNGDGFAIGSLPSSTAGSLFPLDLNGDGDTNDGVVAAGNLELLPVVVIIRWQSLAKGMEGRVQLMTVIGKPQ
jgi:type II secretory pathway pseudopilin PulG